MNIKELKTKIKVQLPPVLDANQAENLYKVMTESLSKQKQVEVEGDNIEKIDTLCAQILVATRIDCSSQNIMFKVKEPSKKLVKTLTLLGLDSHLLDKDTQKA